MAIRGVHLGGVDLAVAVGLYRCRVTRLQWDLTVAV
jgi:hypothetical protein